MKMSEIHISLLLNSLFEVVTSLCRFLFVILHSTEGRVLISSNNITQEFIQLYRWISTNAGWIEYHKSDSKEQYIFVDVIEDYIEDETP